MHFQSKLDIGEKVRMKVDEAEPEWGIITGVTFGPGRGQELYTVSWAGSDTNAYSIELTTEPGKPGWSEETPA